MKGEPLCLQKNVGPIDRVIRVMVGTALIAAPVLLNRSSWTNSILAALGGSTILEGIIGY